MLAHVSTAELDPELIRANQHRGVEQQVKRVGEGSQAAGGDGIEEVFW